VGDGSARAAAAPGLQNKSAKAGGEGGTGSAWRLRWRNEPKRQSSCDLAERPNAGGIRDATGGLWRGDGRDEGDGGKKVGGWIQRGQERQEGQLLNFKFKAPLHSLRLIVQSLTSGSRMLRDV
jgi:hypothetical protein